ncbi:hypothetical protein NMY22_g974 [Coprinellus aureogranulatus]|nr:hypothetical protein NMY22_g974 [Coprinellus aureogranulatus]
MNVKLKRSSSANETYKNSYRPAEVPELLSASTRWLARFHFDFIKRDVQLAEVFLSHHYLLQHYMCVKVNDMLRIATGDQALSEPLAARKQATSEACCSVMELMLAFGPAPNGRSGFTEHVPEVVRSEFAGNRASFFSSNSSYWRVTACLEKKCEQETTEISGSGCKPPFGRTFPSAQEKGILLPISIGSRPLDNVREAIPMSFPNRIWLDEHVNGWALYDRSSQHQVHPDPEWFDSDQRLHPPQITRTLLESLPSLLHSPLPPFRHKMPTTPLVEHAAERMREVSYFSIAFAALASAVVWYIGSEMKARTRRKGHARVPGPKPLPLLGNAMDMPQSHGWLKLASWKQKYGDLIQLDLLGYHIVAVNSQKVARDLLDRRSGAYSDRPHFAFAGELCEFNKSITLMKYDEPWKRQRKIIAQEFSTSSSIPRYWPLQEQQSRLLIKSLLQHPEKSREQIQLSVHRFINIVAQLLTEIKRRLGIIIQRILYGYTVKSADDEFLVNALVSLENFTKAGKLGNYLVDFFSPLKHVPEWFPGAGFKREAKEMKAILNNAATAPYEWVKKHMVTGEALMPNLCGTTFSEAGGPLAPEQEETLRWAAISSVGAGLDTSASTTLTFYLAMIMNPEIQKKAQAEIDSVVGTDRLPAITDRSSLPYIRSIMAEVLRWHPPVPLGIPHSVTRDDFYEGYHIPAGAIVMPNIWYMTHDPEIYDEPMTFKPERFGNSDTDMRQVHDLVFGFGRRTCPGMHFAEGTIFSIMATTFATCDVLPELDESGKPIFPELVFTDGVISFPPEYKCRLKPRSQKALSLLAEATSSLE